MSIVLVILGSISVLWCCQGIGLIAWSSYTLLLNLIFGVERDS